MTTAEGSYLGSGRRYGSEDLAKISRALDRARVPYQVDDQRRVAVPSDQREQAEAAIAKLELGPRLPGEIRDQLPAAQIWESPRDKEVRENQEQAKILESMIGDLPGIVGSFVWINRPKPRLGLQPVARPSAFVRLETEGDRQLPFRTVQSITTILTGYEPGLTADAVTVLDRRGHKYLDAGNPDAQHPLAQSGPRGGAEPGDPRAARLDQGRAGLRATARSVDRRTGRGRAPRRARAAGACRANHRRAGGRNPPPGHPEAGVPSSRSTSRWGRPRLRPRPRLALPAGPAARPREPGRIWVKVPRSYYYQVSILPSRKEPSLEELQKLVARTEEQIKTGHRAGRAAVRPRLVEDDDRRDPRRGAAGPAPRRAVARRFAADRPGLGNRRRDGGDGRRAGAGRCVDPRRPPLVGQAGGGQAGPAPSRRVCPVPRDHRSGFASSSAAIPNRR